jgi:DNA polymerase III epsilon subunit-like protein
MYLFFDTETTGVPRNSRAPVSNLDNWPRVVQLGWVRCDERGGEVSSEEYLVVPDGFHIPVEVTLIHGITTERALGEGIPLQAALKAFSAAAGEAEALVAHNIRFDEQVLGAEFLRMELPNPIPAMSRICTMLASTSFCGIPGRYGYKWPTLKELYRALFRRSPEGSHGALVDARACAECFFELRRMGVLNR